MKTYYVTCTHPYQVGAFPGSAFTDPLNPSVTIVKNAKGVCLGLLGRDIVATLKEAQNCVLNLAQAKVKRRQRQLAKAEARLKRLQEQGVPVCESEG